MPTQSKPKRPTDTNQLAKRIVDLSIGEAKEEDPAEGKNRAFVALGHLGGLKGGKARAVALTATQRTAIAKKAAKARWKKKAETKD